MNSTAEHDRAVAGERRTSTHLAELVSALSLATDLGVGQPMEDLRVAHQRDDPRREPKLPPRHPCRDS